ncbi:hypothetical protein I6E36_12720 [Fusobacterium mortiferum]|uniref:YjcQ family protein n=1 Tax=Fusobacterium mortiferum TaxID=850 RepID=UPI001F291C97|nr:YjcQ family protein [Fusobacterium mortiferum]MCF2628941.1 hypothetical protein [Fusobacterium mortiferum]
MSTSITIFQILKAIDVSYEEKNFDFEKTFDLSKLKISSHRLDLLLENLINDGYIIGLNVSRSIYGEASITVDTPRLTTQGLLFLEENTVMKKAYNTLKEIKDWIPGM